MLIKCFGPIKLKGLAKTEKVHMPTCYEEAKYSEQQKNIKGHNGIFD